jgi:drug/metabolite transporter (DMT)-like permease
MKDHSSVTLDIPEAVPAPVRPARHGLAWGALGILAFSFTVPMTRIAVQGGLDPTLVGTGRAVVAAALAAVVLAAVRPPRPRGRQWLSVAVVAAGVVLGFPLLTSLALRTVEASHAAVVIALLPAVTAVLSCLRTGERPRSRFWWAAGIGAAAAVGFTVIQGGGLNGVGPADLLLLAAVVCCAAGYAEGGVLSRVLGSWQTISWALVVAAPFMALLSAQRLTHGWPHAEPQAWLAFAYLCVVSMFLGFLAWYRGLAIGPLVQVSQVQLAQPLLTLTWSALLLGESIGWATLGGGLVVLACTALAVRSR